MVACVCVSSGWAAGVDRLVLLSGMPPITTAPPVLVVPVYSVSDDDAATPSGTATGTVKGDRADAAVDRYAASVAATLRSRGTPAVCEWTTRRLYKTLRVSGRGRVSVIAIGNGSGSGSGSGFATMSLSVSSHVSAVCGSD
jgi:hypothetical protein